VLRYAVDSCRRFLQKRKTEITSDKKLLNLFAKLSHAYPKEYPAIFEKAYAEICSDDSGQNQDYIDIKGWLDVRRKVCVKGGPSV
jgi:hypothetical protein